MRESPEAEGTRSGRPEERQSSFRTGKESGAVGSPREAGSWFTCPWGGKETLLSTGVRWVSSTAGSVPNLVAEDSHVGSGLM